MSFVTDSILKTALGKIKSWGEGKFVAQESGKGLSTNDYTTAEKTKLSGIAEGANKYTHPTYTAKTSGLYKVTVDGTGHVSATTAVAKADITALGIPAQDTTYSNMAAATASAAGKAGLVPAPAAGKQASFLRGDGSWVVPENTTYADATTSTHGLMSAADKTKLKSQLDEVNKIIAQAENNVRIDEQIADMQQKQREYGQAKADAERILYQLKEVSKRKNELLVEEINEHFGIVRWKLSDFQKNGEYKEVCVPTVLDEETGIYKVFGDTTNTGREIEAKIDICNSFQKFYGMHVPIVLDGAESINNKYLPKVDTQLILLTVSEDKQLKVEGV